MIFTRANDEGKNHISLATINHCMNGIKNQHMFLLDDFILL